MGKFKYDDASDAIDFAVPQDVMAEWKRAKNIRWWTDIIKQGIWERLG